MLLKAKGGMSTSEDNTEDGRYKTQVTGHMSLFYEYRKYSIHL